MMQDLGSVVAKGFKVHSILATWSTSSDVLSSAGWLNLLKNISEAAHHSDPAAAGGHEETDVMGCFCALVWQRGEISDQVGVSQARPIYIEFAEPIKFDANDRLNVEVTFDNDSAGVESGIMRWLLDIEVL